MTRREDLHNHQCVELTPEIEALRKRLFAEYQRSDAGPLTERTFLIQAADLLKAADRMAAGVRRAVGCRALNARSMAADACLDYEGERDRLKRTEADDANARWAQETSTPR